jgi:hypothetical protein
MPGTPVAPAVSAASTAPSASLQGIRSSLNVDTGGKLAKFISKPATFSGINGQNPLTWLKSLRRLFTGVGFSEEEIITIASSYFTGPALTWWNTVESDISSWNILVDRFSNQFANEEQIDLWWSELETLRQGDNNTVDDIKFRCLELFEVLGISSLDNRRRYFLRAIQPYIAQKITEQNKHHDWEELTAAAKRIETSTNKYTDNTGYHSEVERFARTPRPSRPQTASQDGAAAVVQPPAPSSIVHNDDAASVSSLSTVMKELCKDLSALQLSINTSLNEGRRHNDYYQGPRYNDRGRGGYRGGYAGYGNRGGSTEGAQGRSGFDDRVCYSCNQQGHISYDCPNRGNYARDASSRSDDVRNSQGKEMGRQ